MKALEHFGFIIHPFQVQSNWNLATLDLIPKEIRIYDSLGQTDAANIVIKNKILDSMQVKDAKEWVLGVVHISQPVNEADSGVICLLNALYLMAGLGLPANVDIKFWRRAFIHSFLDDDAAADTATDGCDFAAPDVDDPFIVEFPTQVNMLNFRDALKNTLIPVRAARARLLEEASQPKLDSCADLQLILNTLFSDDAIAEVNQTYQKRLYKLHNSSSEVESMLESLKDMEPRMMDVESALEAGYKRMGERREMDLARVEGLDKLRTCTVGMRRLVKGVRAREAGRRETLRKVLMEIDSVLGQLGVSV